MPISDCEVRDPRIRRTRQLLQSSLRTLLQAKAFDEISVNDITGDATLNRATFYDHYTDKFALFDAMVAADFHKLLHERNVRFDGTCPASAASIILATCDFLTQSHSGTGCTRQSAFEPLMEAAITTTIHKVLIFGMTKSDGALSSEMIATTASWAIFGAVKQWFYTPGHPPAEEIVDPILQLVLPILQAATSLGSNSAAAVAHS